MKKSLDLDQTTRNSTREIFQIIISLSLSTLIRHSFIPWIYLLSVSGVVSANINFTPVLAPDQVANVFSMG